MELYAYLLTNSMTGLGLLLDRSSRQPSSNLSTNPTKPQSEAQTTPSASSVSLFLEPAGKWRSENHVHGLAVNPENPDILYVATHNGLLQRSEAGKWFWMV